MSAPTHPIRKPDNLATSRKLNSWKEIAGYLGREVRTVQRWERRNGLPVRRLYHEQRGSVYAFTTELDSWVESRQLRSAASVAGGARRTMRAGFVAIALCCAALVAGIVTHRIGVRLRHAHNPQSASLEMSPAREAYLRGVYLLNLQTDEGVTKSIGEFQKAIARDPRFAPAYAGIAEAHVHLSFADDRSAQVVAARDFAERAMRVNPSSGEVHEALAMIHSYVDWNWMAAENDYQTALRLEPDLATAHSNYAQLEAILGRQDLAVAEAQRAWQLEPLSPTLGASLGWFYYWARRFDDAIATSRQVLQSQPGFASAQACIVRSLVAQRKFSSARKELIGQMQRAGLNYRAAGLDAAEPDRAIRNFYCWELGKLKDQQSTGQFPSFDLAIAFAALGDKDELMRCLEKSYKRRQFIVLLINIEPFFDPYQHEPRLMELSQKLGLPLRSVRQKSIGD